MNLKDIGLNMHKEFIIENMANKFYFEEGDASSYSRLLDVNIFRTEDDSHSPKN